MSSNKTPIQFQFSSNKMIATLLVTVIALSGCLIFSLFENTQTAYGHYYDLGVQLTPEGTIKLGVNQPQTFTATVSGGMYPYTFTWISQVHYADNTTGQSVEFKRETFSQDWAEKYFDGEKPVSTWTFDGFPEASMDYFTVTVEVTDASGAKQGEMCYVFDPYTSVTQYLNGANAADWDYKIETDGLGWYRAVKGDDLSICWTSTDCGTVLQNSIAANVSIVFSAGTFIMSSSVDVSDNSGVTIQGQGNSTVLQLGAGVNDDMFKFSPCADCFTLKDIWLYGNKDANTKGNGLYLAGTNPSGIDFKEWNINNVHISHFAQSGINVTNGLYRSKIIDCSIEQNTLDGIYASNGFHDSVLADSYVYNNGDTGMYLASGSVRSHILRNHLGTNGVDGLTLDTAKEHDIAGNEFSYNGRYGLQVRINSDRNRITQNNFWYNGMFGLYFIGATYNIVVANDFADNSKTTTNTYSDIFLQNSTVATSSNNIFENNVFSGKLWFSNSPKYFIESPYTRNGNNTFIGNQFASNTGGTGILSPNIISLSANNIVKYNKGFVTENSGNNTGTGSQQTIAHGCNFTPTYSQVSLSERSTGGALAYQSAAPDATNIYITATNEKDYNWKIEMCP